jgi:hypothetical protein
MDFNCDLIFRSHPLHELIIETTCLKTMVIPVLLFYFFAFYTEISQIGLFVLDPYWICALYI